MNVNMVKQLLKQNLMSYSLVYQKTNSVMSHSDKVIEIPEGFKLLLIAQVQIMLLSKIKTSYLWCAIPPRSTSYRIR